MEISRLKSLLVGVKTGKVGIEKALHKMKFLPYENISFATIDHHRVLRQGFPEVIFGEGKSTSQIVEIAKKIVEQGNNLLVTRVDFKKAREVKKRLPKSQYHPASRTLTLIQRKVEKRGKGTILVISAGTSDIPIAEEALITAKMLGNAVDHIYDVGIAGLHRLIGHQEKLISASVIIVVAGMEGALPSVVGGMLDKPIISVPTSIGYGSHFGGISALLGMLNSCVLSVCVVNIDNGVGAGYIASLINRL